MPGEQTDEIWHQLLRDRLFVPNAPVLFCEAGAETLQTTFSLCQGLHVWLCQQGQRGSPPGWKGRRDLLLPSCFLCGYCPLCVTSCPLPVGLVSTVCDFLSACCSGDCHLATLPHPGSSSSFLKCLNPVCNVSNTYGTRSITSPHPTRSPPRLQHQRSNALS